MRIDLHTHSRVSDGTDSPTRLVMAAREAGLDVIALTDHDTFDGITEAMAAGRRIGVRVVPGIELSTERDGHSVHLLGYGCDPANRALAEELVRIREGRSGRIPAMCEALTAAGCPVTVDDVLKAAQGSPSVGRPHVADALIARGHVGTRNEAFDRFLAEGKPGYVHRYACPLPLAIDLVHDAGGVAVLAHPWGRGRREVLPAPFIEDLVREHGLEGIEVDHEDHDVETRSLLFEMGARLGLIRTGSSDYHGSGKKGHPLGINLTRKSAFNELLARIRLRGGSVG